MELSTDLIKQFVEVTNDSKTSNESKTTHRATAVVNNKGIYVKLDGSDILTPVSMATDARDGDRVLVTIENHRADIIGNITSPGSGRSATDLYSKEVQEDGTIVVKGELRVAKEYVDELIAGDVTAEMLVADNARISKLEADKANISDLNATNAKITELEASDAEIRNLVAGKANISDLNATNAKITDLEANKADISDLNATNAKITELEASDADINNLVAGKANISDLTATNAKITNLEANKANIDFSNIGKAAMEYFYAQSGLIKDVVVGGATITGQIVGVTISGDRIKGNTIVAEKLVIKGEDGLYYKLNTDGITTEAEQTDYNSLNGQIIKAQSITASKIAVDDLIAFDATIGGFNIGTNSIYSGVKESVNNTTRGIYLDTDGQIAFGDASNFIKYYKDAEGNYQLEINAKSIKFGLGGTSVEEAIDNLKDEITTNLRIESSRGTVFKNDQVSTVLSAVIYHGSQRITDSATLKSTFGSGAYLQWKWQKLDETSYGIISASDSRFSNDGFTFTLSPEDVDTKVTFMCELIV